MNRKKGILIVSFGTSYADTREKTITSIENTIRHAHPEIQVYTAWTSKIIMAKLLKTTGEKICTVSEALEQMALDQITDVFIQTTHVINGIEFDLLKEDAMKYQDRFSSLSFGNPLISSTEDMKKVIRIIADEFKDILSYDTDSKDALILMGHGSEHHSNTAYAALDYMFKEMGYPNIYMGTVEAYPFIEEILGQLRNTPVTCVHLAPFMIVAGDHANNDMAGDTEDSWAFLCEKAGYDVTCHLKGLGEYSKIHELFLEHLDKIID
ncbi:MAG: sirohydrochlorin cobaltochelatase [Lachnospiraceae bacterium]